MPVTITGTAALPTGAVLPSKSILFTPNPIAVIASEGQGQVPETVQITTGAAGQVTLTLTPGPYVGEVDTGNGLVRFPFNVPNQPTATFTECIQATAAAVYDALALGLLAASAGRMFPTAALGYAAPEVPVGGAFLAMAAGVLTVFRKDSPTTGASLGALFPAGAFAAGSAAAPGLVLGGDADTGLFLQAANSLGLAAGGVQRALINTTGLVVTGQITGSAVTQSATDWTTGRLMKVGDFGLGVQFVEQITDLTLEIRPGFYWFLGSTVTGGPPDTSVFQWQLLVTKGGAGVPGNNFLAFKMAASGAGNRMFWGSRNLASGAIIWSEIRGSQNLLGTVSQSGGVPTGAVIERGSNANGEFVRFADGTQICTARVAVSLAISTAFLGGFRSAAQAWTFPAAFAATPQVTPTAALLSATGAVLDTTSTTAANWAVTAVATQGAATRTVDLIAVGRWF